MLLFQGKLQLVMTFLFMVQSNRAQAALRTRRTILAGGFHPVDTDDLKVMQAANFVVESLRLGVGTDVLAGLPPPSHDSALHTKVLEAWEQVVAGMNYKMKIAIFDGDKCIGGLSPTVYVDLQGNYSVSSYGEEISCDAI